MKITKPMLIAALVAGNLFAWDMALRADDSTNAPAANVKSHARGFDRMAEDLNLTADQKPKVKTIMDAQMQKSRAVRQDDSLSRDDKHAKMKSIHDDTATQLKAVLTADQFSKWQKMSHHMHRPPPDAPPQN
ncbi:MAG: hypothetical protein ACREDS_07665 [Limisphaerales bacterium]